MTTATLLVCLAGAVGLFALAVAEPGVGRSGEETARSHGTAAAAGNQRRHGRRGRRGRPGPAGPRGPAGPPGPGPHGYVTNTRAVDVSVSSGQPVEVVASCRPDAADLQDYAGSAHGGGAYFLGADAGADEGLVTSYPGVTQPDGSVTIAKPDDFAPDAWVARVVGTSGAAKTVRVFVICYGAGP